MDLELVCWILWESWRFLWAQTVSRFRTSLVWNGQALVQVARTRPTFINNMDVSSAADTVTNIGSPGMQAYTSANTDPGATRFRYFPWCFLLKGLPLLFENYALWHSGNPKEMWSLLLPVLETVVYWINSYFSLLVVITTDFHFIL